ncbi:hypothetical protein Tco_1240747 [Tanacetum coccineum]
MRRSRLLKQLTVSDLKLRLSDSNSLTVVSSRDFPHRQPIFQEAWCKWFPTSPFHDEFIPNVMKDDGICYTHPQKLPSTCTFMASAHLLKWFVSCFHLGTSEDEKDGEYVILEVFYRQQTNTKSDGKDEDIVLEYINDPIVKVDPVTPKSATLELTSKVQWVTTV